MIINAQRIGVTNTCEAMDCPHDADQWGLCTRHARQQARGEHVRMHVIPEPLPEKLRCSACGKWKHDDAFPLLDEARRRAGGNPVDRRGRYCRCRSCERRERNTLKANSQDEPGTKVEG